MPKNPKSQGREEWTTKELILELAWQVGVLMEDKCGNSGKNWFEAFQNTVFPSKPLKKTK